MNTKLTKNNSSSELDRRELELEGLQFLARALSENTSQKTLLQKVIDILESHFGFARTTIMLVSGEGDKLQVESTTKSIPINPQAIYSMGEGVTGKVLESGQAIIVPRISQETDFFSRIHQRSDLELDHSFVCVPITAELQTVGTLSCDLLADNMQELDNCKRILTITASLIANDVAMRRRARMEMRTLMRENMRLRDELIGSDGPANMVGTSRAMREVYIQMRQVAPSDTTVLIRGESGTGKELLAAAIHYNSKRKDKPFVRVNCAALNENLLESELFGHEKGAFTGAVSKRSGRLQQAEGGTLLLDEIGDFSTAIQVKLLRMLQEREYQPVGSNRTIKADVRIICATNSNLEQGVEKGTFRQDLYYRINVFPISLPPLRKRKEDILPLAESFLQKHAHRANMDTPRIGSSARNLLLAYDWPGNVRELENSMQRAILLADNGVIRGYHLPSRLEINAPTSKNDGTLKTHVRMLERDMIIDALRQSVGNIQQAANILGLSSRMIRYKIEQMGIDYRRYRRSN